MSKIENYQYLLELFKSCLEIEYRHIEGGGSFAALRDGDLLYIFFEKSNGAEDWYNNLSYHAVRDGNLFIHEGFLRVWQGILPYLKELIENPSVERIITVGYSHGGALSLLCHRYIYDVRPDLRGSLDSYAYGCPRVLYGAGPKGTPVWENFYRIVNVGDLVTHLPPQFFGYRHVGNEVRIGKEGRYSSMDAHRSENYIKELEFMADIMK